jgi:hypothetical protein
MDRKMKALVAAVIGVAGVLAQQPQLSAPVGIFGTVKGADGTLVAKATVSLSRTQASPFARNQRTEWTTATAVDGTFQFPAVPPGSYVLCAQGANWLNPCEWGKSPVQVAVGAYQKPGGVTIVLKPAATFTIRVEDAGQLLNQHEGKTAGAHLLIGVSSDAFVFHPAVLAWSDNAGRNYQVTVPYDASVNLVLGSSFFSVADDAGSALPQRGSASIPIRVPTGQPPAAVKFHVTGAGH